MNFPKPPSDWVDPELNSNKDEPIFRSVDNPGKWSSFSFRPTFKGARNGGKYERHALPTGCTPVPVSLGSDGSTEERVQKDWKFYYEGWQPQDKKMHESSSIEVVPINIICFQRNEVEV